LITQTLGEFFVELLPGDTRKRIERVYWTFEGPVLRIWSVIQSPDSQLEHPIYDAQLSFMDKFPELEFDFSVIYRFGKNLKDIRPEGSAELFPLH
jgi:hypothetical protein